MNRVARHRVIRTMLDSGPVTNQGMFVEAFSDAGFDVAQATVSRDLRWLGVVKGPHGYTLPDQAASSVPVAALDSVAAMVRGVQCAGTMVVVHTLVGYADAVAVQIDATGYPEMVGSIAGDDTIFLAAESFETAAHLRDAVAASFAL